jgi:hypothetical protein
MGKKEVEGFLSHLASHGKVSASTQRQALNAIVFLYRAGYWDAPGRATGTPLFLCIIDLNQVEVIDSSNSLATIGRSGYGWLADSKHLRYGYGRHTETANGPMA